MAQFREREEDENDGIPVDLKQKVCPTCRRKLQPWEPTCPEDGSTPVAGVEMGSVEDNILGRLNPDLLDDLDDESDPEPLPEDAMTFEVRGAEPPPPPPTNPLPHRDGY